MTEKLIQFAREQWTSGIEIALIAVVIYYAYIHFRGTRGAKVLTGLALIFLTLTLISRLLQLQVIGWLLQSFTGYFAIALIVIFQPELRRALAELGSHRLFSTSRHERQVTELIVDTAVQLANKGFGALIAIERDTRIRAFAESGIPIDCQLSQEMLLTIFHPKTVLHDGGVIIRDDRIIAAACIFPVSQRETLDRSLGLRHRAGLGISEESDAIAIVISEETGGISICHRGVIERNFTHESLQHRLGQLLLAENDEKNLSAQLESEGDLPRPRDSGLVPDQGDTKDTLAV